jgi:membrane protease YdiL (CAAX protease family)
MTHLGLFPYLFAGVLALGGVAIAPFERWAYRANAGASRKFLGYAVTILYLWALAGIAVRIDGLARLLISPGPAAAWLPAAVLVGPALAVVVTAYFLFALLPLIQSLRGTRWRRAYQLAIRHELARIPGMVPNNSAERAAWIAISLTAGICEEILFRGFLIRFLYESASALPIAAALAVSCLCFGLAHVYLGPKGALNAAIGGFSYGCLFLLSGSLIPSILLHALVDLQMPYVMRPISRQAAARAPEMA